MSLKHHANEASRGRALAWGELVETGHALTLRFEMPERSVSFPLGVVRRWELMSAATEQLVIDAADELITIDGRGLAAVRDALDQNALAVLRVQSPAPTGRVATCVTAITFEAR